MSEPMRDTSKAALVGKKCCKRVMGDFRFYFCNKPAKVIENGGPFCGIHDPEKDRKRAKAWDEKWEQDKQRRAAEDAKRAEDARCLSRYDRAIQLIVQQVESCACAIPKPSDLDEILSDIASDKGNSSCYCDACLAGVAFLAEEPKR